MEVYLQPSPVRWLLDATADFCKQSEGRLHPIDYALAVRARLIGASIIGMAQAVHCFALFVILSTASLLTLGVSDRIEHLVRYTGSLCGAGLVGIFFAMSSMRKTRAFESMTQRLIQQTDERFAALSEKFHHAFDLEAEELRKQRRATALLLGQKERREFHDRAVKRMRAERVALKQLLKRAYPADSKGKYHALSESQGKMAARLAEQRRLLALEPYTQAETDRYFVQRTFALADDALEELYRYPKWVFTQRIETCGEQWDREGFAEQCLKLYKTQRVEEEVNSLVNDVRNAQVSKERAHRRFVTDSSAFVRRMKSQVDKIEYPYLFKRVWWKLKPWVHSIGYFNWR